MHLVAFGPPLPKAPTTQAAYVPCPPLHSSELHPLCATRDWLCLWHPLLSAVSPHLVSITNADCQNVASLLMFTWATSTLEIYRARLLLYHSVCDTKSIPEHNHALISPDFLSVFLAKLAGIYSASALSGYFATIQTWHHLHHVPWMLDLA